MRALLIEDDPSDVELVREALMDLAMPIELAVATNAAAARQELSSRAPDLVLLDLSLPGESGLELLAQLRREGRRTDLPVAIVTGSESAADRRACEELGVVAFFSKGPYRSLTQFLDQVLGPLARGHAVVPAPAPVRVDARRPSTPPVLDASLAPREPVVIVGSSPVMRRVEDQVVAVAGTDSPVLIEGEPGTGKELAARAIHGRGIRRDGPLVKLNCACLDAFGGGELLEDAVAWRGDGGAMGGTLLLDEVHMLSSELQALLLRLVHDNELTRVKENSDRGAGVRIIAASTADLPGEVEAGRFRRDLYFRLAVFPLRMPPIREHRSDLPELVEHLLAQLSLRTGRRLAGVTPAGMKRIQEHSWPGNVSELRTALEQALPTADAGWLDVRCEPPGSGPRPLAGLTLDEAMARYMEDVLRQTGWVIEGPKGAALRLGLKPSTLRSKLKRLGVERRRT